MLKAEQTGVGLARAVDCVADGAMLADLATAAAGAARMGERDIAGETEKCIYNGHFFLIALIRLGLVVTGLGSELNGLAVGTEDAST